MADEAEDPRCCGTGHCMISPEGLCWCGQQWDGVQMCYPKAAMVAAASASEPAPDQDAAKLAKSGNAAKPT